MPLYDYKCQEHGVFHELATIDDSGKPCACPICGALSSRVILVAPEILDMSPAKRKAHQVNESASHAPIHSTVESRHEKHGRGCGCEKQAPMNAKAIYLANGNKIFPSARPWMISH